MDTGNLDRNTITTTKIAVCHPKEPFTFLFYFQISSLVFSVLLPFLAPTILSGIMAFPTPPRKKITCLKNRNFYLYSMFIKNPNMVITVFFIFRALFSVSFKTKSCLLSCRDKNYGFFYVKQILFEYLMRALNLLKNVKHLYQLWQPWTKL